MLSIKMNEDNVVFHVHSHIHYIFTEKVRDYIFGRFEHDP